MKLQTFLLSTVLMSTLHAADTNPTAPVNVKMEGVGYIKQLGGALKSELKKHMQADPTGVAALGFCTAKAMELTEEVNKGLPTHAKVRRTALKVRNSANTADATDAKVMQHYIDAINAKTFSETDIQVIEEGNTTRVYKPLLTEGVCLKCHGSNISKEISDMVKSSYPDDEAIGFKEGDLRGVVVAEIKKH